jgi:hypothetical protein
VLDAVAESATRTQFPGERLDWMHALRAPVLVDSSKARRLLGWRPRYDALDTLRQTVADVRRRGLLGSWREESGDSTNRRGVVGAVRQAPRGSRNG